MNVAPERTKRRNSDATIGIVGKFVLAQALRDHTVASGRAHGVEKLADFQLEAIAVARQ
jgi:hypothetical protein